MSKATLEKTHKINLQIVKVEKESVVVMIDGWRIRVYGNVRDLRLGQSIEVEYTGEIKDIHSVKLLPLK